MMNTSSKTDKSEARSSNSWVQTYERKLEQGNMAEAEGFLISRFRSFPADFHPVRLLCRLYQDRGDLHLAEDVLRQCLHKDPESIPARIHLAHIFWLSGRVDEALQGMHAVLRVSPEHDDVWNTLLGWYKYLGKTDKAMETAQEWLNIAPASGAAHLQIGRLLFDQERYLQALEYFENASADAVVALDAGLDIARVKLRIEETEAGVDQIYRCLAESVRFLPRHISKLISIAQQLISLGYLQAVVECCEATQCASANDPLWLALYISALSQSGRTEDAKQYLAHFSELYQFRYQNGIAIEPTRFAQALWVLERHDEALAELRVGLNLRPESEATWRQQIRWLEKLGREEASLEAAREWVEALPQSGQAHWQVARQLVRACRHEEAQAHIEKALADARTAIDAGFDIARSYVTVEDPERALVLLDRILTMPERIANRHAGAIMSLARAFHTRRRYDVAERCCEAIKDVSEDDPAYLALYGNVLLSKGEIERARVVLGRVEENVKSVWARIRLAEALWELERHDEALAELRTGLKLRPESEATWRQQISWLEKLGREAESLDAAREWVEALPQSGQAHWQVARQLVRSGRYVEAQEHIERALADADAAIDAAFDIVRSFLLSRDVAQAEAITARLIFEVDRPLKRYAGSIMTLAQAFLTHRKYDMAERCCEAILEWRGQGQAFLALYGNILLSKGEIIRARVVLEKSVFMAPTSDKAPRFLLALSYFHSGQAVLGKYYLSEAVGFQEEGKAFAAFFGRAAPLIPFFGAEIDNYYLREDK